MLDNIINNMLTVNKEKLNHDTIKLLMKEIKLAFIKNKKTFNEVYQIDSKHDNGFILDYDIINRIFNNLEKENLLYGDVTLSVKDKGKKIIYGKEIFDIGNVLVLTDGNPYIIIELILRNILAGNTSLFVTSGKYYGLNEAIIRIVKHVLTANHISEYLVNIYETEDYDLVLNNYANIDLVIAIGNHQFQNLIISKSKNKVITSGYEHYDLYFEDNKNIEFIYKIIATNADINIYTFENVELDYLNTINVVDIDEAIARINYHGNKYSASIFTDNSENAHKFIKEVKSKIITVNTSPTIERIIDINQNDLINEKTIIYPYSFKLDGNTIETKINKNS